MLGCPGLGATELGGERENWVLVLQQVGNIDASSANRTGTDQDK